MVNCMVANAEINQMDLHTRNKIAYKSSTSKPPVSSSSECSEKNACQRNCFLGAFRFFSFQVKTFLKGA